MPGMPAARTTDMHTCPMCMGAMLPVLPPCAPTVLIGKLPAARMTDLCACIAPIPVPVDMIAFGTPTVLISGLPAARQFDPTAKGGAVMTGLPTVLIGIVAAPAPGQPGALDVWNETLADGSVVTHVGANITITGTAAFRSATLLDLQRLNSTPTGRDLISTMSGPGRGAVTIVETTGGNEVDGFGRQARLQPDGSHGTGTGSTLHYNPNRTQIDDGSEPYMTRPPAVGLGHELVHCEQAQNGAVDTNRTGGVANAEPAAVGLPPYDGNPHSENNIRRDLGQPQRTRY